MLASEVRLGLLEELGIPVDTQLLTHALTHRSFAYENGGLANNERLEFLGDSVLGVVVTETLFRRFPERPEGELAKLRSAVVNARALADVARSLDLGPMVRLGKGEIATGGHDKNSILADTMEAIIGAVFLAHGHVGAERFVHSLFDPLVETAATMGASLDWKTSLQELASGLGLGVPIYHLSDTGPDHDKSFSAAVVVGEHRFGPGIGRNKKQAEQEAAALGFAALQPLDPGAAELRPG